MAPVTGFAFCYLLANLFLTTCEAQQDGGITRPCPDNDLDCIRDYFSTHGQCAIPNREPPESTELPLVLKVHFSHVNTTAVYDSLLVRNFTGKVTDFYVNCDTDNAVLTVDFCNLSYRIPKLTYHFHRRGNEPVRASDFLDVVFTSSTATATISDINNLQMKDAFITAYTEDAYPCYTLGPKIVNNKCIAGYLKTLLSDMPVAVRHFLDITMAFALQSFVRYTICDFDMPPNTDDCDYK